MLTAARLVRLAGGSRFWRRRPSAGCVPSRAQSRADRRSLAAPSPRRAATRAWPPHRSSRIPKGATASRDRALAPNRQRRAARVRPETGSGLCRLFQCSRMQSVSWSRAARALWSRTLSRRLTTRISSSNSRSAPALRSTTRGTVRQYQPYAGHPPSRYRFAARQLPPHRRRATGFQRHVLSRHP